jgi:SHS2 domain-containing protein
MIGYRGPESEFRPIRRTLGGGFLPGETEDMGYVAVEIDHTADTAIRVTADTLEELYLGAAESMFAVTARVPEHAAGTPRTYTVEGADRTELLWNLLSALLSEAEADGVTLRGISVVLDGMSARVDADAVPIGAAQVVGPPIKAVTWHGLDVVREDGRWTATVVFDI